MAGHNYYLTLPAYTLLFHGSNMCEDTTKDPEQPPMTTSRYLKGRAFLFTSQYRVASAYRCKWMLGVRVTRPLRLFLMTRNNISHFLRHMTRRHPQLAWSLKQVTGLHVAKQIRFDGASQKQVWPIPASERNDLHIMTSGYLSPEDAERNLYAAARLAMVMCEALPDCDGWIYPSRSMYANASYDARRRAADESGGAHFHDELLLCGKVLHDSKVTAAQWYRSAWVASND